MSGPNPKLVTHFVANTQPPYVYPFSGYDPGALYGTDKAVGPQTSGTCAPSNKDEEIQALKGRVHDLEECLQQLALEVQALKALVAAAPTQRSHTTGYWEET